ncbi:GtrA family protein [Marinobacter sp.]|uniref:GtrA family protein n=1 Tax=Marinobacter sp. TaxID=50741 RepID=UPI003B5245C0
MTKPTRSPDTGRVNLRAHRLSIFPGFNMVAYVINKRLSLQLRGFLAAGGLATLFHWLVMTGLIGAGLEPTLATAGGSFSGAVMNYGLQRRLAFPYAGPHRSTVWRYLASCGLAWLCNLVFFYMLNHALGLSVMHSQLATTGLVAALNYVVYQRLVFYEQKY